MDYKLSYFVFRREWYNAIMQIDDTVRLEVYDAIMRKAFYNEQPHLSTIANIVMTFVEPQLEEYIDKQIEIRTIRSECGKMGGRPQKAKESKKKQKKQMLFNDDDYIINNINNTNKEKEEKNNLSNNSNNIIICDTKGKKRFVKPTIEEIKAYIQEKGYTLDAEAFFAYYESNGWRVGRNPMKNWKMACTTWERNKKNNNNNNYGRSKSNSDRFMESMQQSDEFSQKLRQCFGQQTELGFADDTEIW